MTEPILAAVQQWLLFAGVTTTTGCVAWRWIVATGAGRTLRDAPAHAIHGLEGIERRVASVGLLTAVLLIAVWGLKMVVQVMGFRDPFVPLWEDVSFLLFETFWGTVWMVQGALIPLSVFAFWWAGRFPGAGPSNPRQIPFAWHAATGLVLGIVATLALSSHAMGVDTWKPLVVMADGLHTLAAGTWIGSLGLIVTAGRPRGETPAALDLYAAQIESFSSMAILSVAILLSMGILLAWVHLTAVSDLWTMAYGRILSAKIGLAGLVFVVGFANWRKGIPALGTESGALALQRRARWEVFLAAGVLALTAVLVHSVKP